MKFAKHKKWITILGHRVKLVCEKRWVFWLNLFITFDNFNFSVESSDNSFCSSASRKLLSNDLCYCLVVRFWNDMIKVSYERWSERMNFLESGLVWKWLLWTYFEHCGQTNFFSPVCVRRCRWSSSDRVNRLVHMFQSQTEIGVYREGEDVFILCSMVFEAWY